MFTQELQSTSITRYACVLLEFATRQEAIMQASRVSLWNAQKNYKDTWECSQSGLTIHLSNMTSVPCRHGRSSEVRGNSTSQQVHYK